jgi:hypothetical protein
MKQVTQIKSIEYSKTRTGITTDRLWIVVVLGLTWFFISILPLPPNDLWWHLAAGRIMINEGQLLTENRFAYTVPTDAPYIYQMWLSELILYGSWRLGDVPALTLLRTVVIVLSYGLVAWCAARRAGSGHAAALALLVAVLIGWNNWTLRPQTLMLLPAAAFVVLLVEYLDGRISTRWLFALPVLQIIWVNGHGSFVLGIALIGLAWLGLAYRTVIGQKTPLRQAFNTMLPFTLATGATVLAAFVNPLGVGIIGYLRGLFGTAELAANLEWQQPTTTIDFTNTGFWFFAMLLGIAGLFAAGRKKPPLVEVLWYLALSWLAVGAVRHAMWYALLLMPMFANQIAGWLRTAASQRLGRGPLMLFGSLLGAIVIATLPWLTPGTYLGSGTDRLFAPAGPNHLLLSRTTPIMASEWLAQNPIEGRLWTDMTSSSYISWRVPEKQIFADMRIELFPQSVWDEYYAIAEGGEQSLELINTWQITHMLLFHEQYEELDQLLAKQSNWCERYRDSTTVIWTRCQP